MRIKAFINNTLVHQRHVQPVNIKSRFRLMFSEQTTMNAVCRRLKTESSTPDGTIHKPIHRRLTTGMIYIVIFIYTRHSIYIKPTVHLTGPDIRDDTDLPSALH